MKQQSHFYLDPIQFQQSALPTIQSLKYAYSGFNSNITIGQIFGMIEQLNVDQLHEFWVIMSQIHSCEVMHIQKCCVNLKNTFQNSLNSFKNNKTQMQNNTNKQNKQIEKCLNNKALVKSALVQVVSDFNVHVNDSISDRDLCILVNQTVQQDKTQQFWNKVAQIVPSKNKKQVYDFYRILFSKALYDSQITREDTKQIEQLNTLYSDEKPSVLAQLFLDKTGRKIMKHDVIMCFVNIRRKASKQVK
ncbi:Hypothetical_protein [Hexamita inflata]|uniref:Hypothetical_protein n=1 Tax=Hexamita inflata TaxID=28002 RepID=A0AA86V1U2_9EUKA|nr:Hypothetical protein HINF_LOCUS65009 [Hexamita inflata]